MSADLDGVSANLPPVGGTSADGAGAVAPQKETDAAESRTQSAGLDAIMPEAKNPTEAAAPIPASRTAIGAAREPSQRLGGQRFITDREIKAKEAKEAEVIHAIHKKFISILDGALQGESSGLKEALITLKGVIDRAPQKAKDTLISSLGVEVEKLDKQRARWEKLFDAKTTASPETIRKNLEPIDNKIEFLKKLEFYPAFTDALSHIKEAVSQQKEVHIGDILTISATSMTDEEEVTKLQELYEDLDVQLQQLGREIARSKREASSTSDKETALKTLESKQTYIQKFKKQLKGVSGIKTRV